MSATPFTRVKSTVALRTDLKRWLPADDGEHRAAISHAYRILDGVLDGKGKPLSKDLKTIILRSIAAVPKLTDLGHGTRFESAEAWDNAVQHYADRCKELQQWGVTHEACIQWVHIRDFTHTKDPVEAWFTEVTERLAKGERPPPPVTFADMQAERIERSRKGYVNMTIKTEDTADIKEWTAKRQLCYKAAQDVGRTAITDSEPWLDQVFGKPWKETIRPMSRADVEAKLAEAKAAEVKTDEPEPEAPKAEPEPEAPKVNGKELKEIWGDKLMKRHGRSQAGKVFLEVVGWAKWDDAIDPSKGAMTDQDVVGLLQKHLDALDAATPEAPTKPAEPPITSAVEPPEGFPGEQPESATAPVTPPSGPIHDDEPVTVDAETGEIVPTAALSIVRYMPSIERVVNAYNMVVALTNRNVLKAGVDYGRVPGTEKNTLLKPGAEKLANGFGYCPEFEEMNVVRQWTGSEPFFAYEYRCNLRSIETGKIVATAIGSCNSFESKYRWRWVQAHDVDPNTDMAKCKSRTDLVREPVFAIEKAETAGKYGKPLTYWQRFTDAIANGTATKVKIPRANGNAMDGWEIKTTLYRVPNEDVFSQVNTISKMAQKRALIAAVLIGCNASEFFTQDLEDLEEIA